MAGEKKKARILIGLLRDGELNEKERSIVEEQIKLDPGLKDELKKYELLGDILNKAEKVEIPASPHLEYAVLERVRSGDEERGWNRLFKGIISVPRKYSFEIVGATAVAVLVLFAVYRFVPGFTTTRDIVAEGELEVGKAAPSAPAKLDDAKAKPPESPLESTGDEEAADEASEKASEKDKAVVPLTVHEEPEDVTLPLVKGKPKGKAPTTVVSPDSGGTHTYSDMVAVRSAARGVKSEALPNRLEGRDSRGDAGKGMKTLIFKATDEKGHPINLIIYTDNPDKVRYDIENKAIELSAGYRAEKGSGGSYVVKESKDKKTTVFKAKRSSRNIHIPQERVREFLTYIESNYPPTKTQIEELDIDERNSLFNIEFSIPKEDE